MQASDVPYKFQEIWAAAAVAGYVTTPIPDTAAGGSASQSLGFPPVTAQPVGSGGIPPDIADFNGILQYATAWSQWFQAGAPVRYDATFQTNIGGYPEGAVVESASSPGRFWVSTIDNNSGNPDTGSTNWRPWPWFHSLAIASNTTLTRVVGWTSYTVAVGVTVTLPAASAAQGTLLAFTASGLCTITSPSGTFLGGAQTGLASLPLPTNAYVMILSDGTAWRILSSSIQSGLLLRPPTPIISSLTYTPATGATYCIVEVQAGGGAGGGTAATSGSQGAVGGPGGGGSYARVYVPAGLMAGGVAVTIGAPGVGSSSANGGDAAATTVGTIINAPGGKGGIAGPAQNAGLEITLGGVAAAPVTASGGGVVIFANAEGSAGQTSLLVAIDKAVSGVPGGGAMGVGSPQSSGGNGNVGASYGVGGSPSMALLANGAYAGGDGGPAIVIISDYS